VRRESTRYRSGSPTPATLNEGEWPRAISGSPTTISGLLERLADRVGADETVIRHAVPDHWDALDSHAPSTEAVELEGRGPEGAASEADR